MQNDFFIEQCRQSACQASHNGSTCFITDVAWPSNFQHDTDRAVVAQLCLLFVTFEDEAVVQPAYKLLGDLQVAILGHCCLLSLPATGARHPRNFMRGIRQAQRFPVLCQDIESKKEAEQFLWKECCSAPESSRGANPCSLPSHLTECSSMCILHTTLFELPQSGQLDGIKKGSASEHLFYVNRTQVILPTPPDGRFSLAWVLCIDETRCDCSAHAIATASLVQKAV